MDEGMFAVRIELFEMCYLVVCCRVHLYVWAKIAVVVCNMDYGTLGSGGTEIGFAKVVVVAAAAAAVAAAAVAAAAVAVAAIGGQKLEDIAT